MASSPTAAELAGDRSRLQGDVASPGAGPQNGGGVFRGGGPAPFLPLLRRELGRPVEAAFAELDPAPLASASLAQVHRGRLRDGREVAVKMQYPDIERIVRVDLRSFAVLIGVLARLERDFDFRALIREVEKYVPLELDFVHEADNAERMARHLGGRPDILVPAIVRELSTRRVLVMEYVPGVRVTDVEAFRALGFRTREASDESLAWLGEAFLGWALRNGRSFADPEMIAELGAELPRVMRANPLVEVPADVLLVGRVMGLLSGIGKQLGAHVDLGATLLPYLAAGAARPQA